VSERLNPRLLRKIDELECASSIKAFLKKMVVEERNNWGRHPGWMDIYDREIRKIVATEESTESDI